MSARMRLLVLWMVCALLLAVMPVSPSAAATAAPEEYVSYGGHAHTIAGGAPIWVRNWTNVGHGSAPPSSPEVDAATWASYRQYPADGTYLRGGDGRSWRIVSGGRPVPVGDGSYTYYKVDATTVAACGTDAFGVQRLNCSPWGALESAVATGVGQVTVSGWAMDPEQTAGPVEYSWLIDGTGNQGGNSGYANQPHGAVPASSLPAGNFGFSRTISVPSGTRTICLYLHDGGNYGRSLTMNCATVNVPAPPLPPTAFPSAPRKVKAVAKQGKAVVKWKAPASSGDGPVTEYVVLASTGQKVNTKKTKAVVRRLKPGKKVTFTVTAYNKFGAGAESKRTKKVRIRR